MDQRLSEKIANLQQTLDKAQDLVAVEETIVALERLVLKANADDFAAVSGGKSQMIPYTTEDFIVSEPNVRGLTWKIFLLRAVTNATFCGFVRVGPHGGRARILGQPDNIIATKSIYNALVPTYERLSESGFTTHKETAQEDSSLGTVHKVGWINAFLLGMGDRLTEVIQAARDEDLAGNAKLQAAIAGKEEELKAYRTPQPAEPKTPKTAKAKKTNGVVAEQGGDSTPAAEGNSVVSEEIAEPVAASA